MYIETERKEYWLVREEEELNWEIVRRKALERERKRGMSKEGIMPGMDRD